MRTSLKVCLGDQKDVSWKEKNKTGEKSSCRRGDVLNVFVHEENWRVLQSQEVHLGAVVVVVAAAGVAGVGVASHCHLLQDVQDQHPGMDDVYRLYLCP